MNTYTRRRRSPQGQCSNTGKRYENVHTQAQHGAVPGSRADGEDPPFPNKPVGHRRSVNPRKQHSLDSDFEKATVTKELRGPLSSEKHLSNVIRESQHQGKDSQRLPRGEQQMAREIHAKELMLQEKLWRLEEKVRQKILRDSVDGESEEEQYDGGQAWRGNTQANTAQPVQREAAKGREMMKQDRKLEDVQQLKKRQDRRNDERLKTTHEEERAVCKRRESPQLHRKGHKETHDITAHKQEASGKLNKSRWENIKEHTRRNRGDETDNGRWRMTDVTSQDGTETTKKRGQKATHVDDQHRTREKSYGERKYKELYGSDSEQDEPQRNQQKTYNHRGEGRNLSVEPVHSRVSGPSHSSRPEQRELGLTDTVTSLQLLPCRVCNRKFASERLQKHVQICEKVKQSHRQVFNSYANRTKGSSLEEYFKTHTRSKTPEILQKNLRWKNKANMNNLNVATTSQPKRYK